ncbi:MAG: hypothetical protein U9R48_10550 [Chloroflexota bacterium]|nr:hypothetical protein [Chloroflexota bacterium]
MRNLRYISMGNALIWAAAIIAVAVILRGTKDAGTIVVILGGAAGASVILVSSAMREG